MDCGHCGGCCSPHGGCGETLALTAEELAMLRRFAQIPFLPMAGKSPEEAPVFLEDGEALAEADGTALLGLAGKGLIRLDWDIPLSNFGYEAYKDYPFHGSMALTARGLAAVELLEIQGIEE